MQKYEEGGRLGARSLVAHALSGYVQLYSVRLVRLYSSSGDIWALGALGQTGVDFANGTKIIAPSLQGARLGWFQIPGRRAGRMYEATRTAAGLAE